MFAASGLVLGAEAARDLAEALRRAHVHGYDAGRSDGNTEMQGYRREGHAKAWADFLATECPPDV